MRKLRLTALVLLLMFGLSGCMQNPYETGVETLESGEYEAAAENFETAARKGNHTADAYRGLGIALWETKDYEGAADAFKKALDEGTEKTATLYNFLGSCQLELGNPKEAIAYYEMGLARDDLSDELEQEMRFNIIVAYEKQDDLEMAKKLIEEYAADYPDDQEAAKEAQFLETR